MKKKAIKVSAEPKIRDLNAKMMWGRTRSQSFRDKTKYTRKIKYKIVDED